VRVFSIVIAIVIASPTIAWSADAFRDLDLIRPARTQQAPDFTVPGVRGERYALRDVRGKLVLLNFWATWCPPCKEEMPSMERLYRRYNERGLTILAVSIDSGGAQAVAEFATALGLTFPIGLDQKLEVANRYGVRALPSTFLIDRDGNTAAVALGPRDWDGSAAHAVIESLLR